MNNRDYLKVKRREAGLTQRGLAALIGCSVDSVSLTERGRMLPRAELRARYAATLGAMEAELFPDAGVQRGKRSIKKVRGEE